MAKYPYRDLEDKYVRGTMSLRALARDNGIPANSVSGLISQARKKDDNGRDWHDKRADYQNRSYDKTVEQLAEREARRAVKAANVVDSFYDLMDEAIKVGLEQIREKRTTIVDGEERTVYVNRVNFRDLSLLLDRFNVLMGRPAQITEERGVRFNVDVGSDSPAIHHVARLVDLSRERAGSTERGTVVSTALPVAEDPRQN